MTVYGIGGECHEWSCADQRIESPDTAMLILARSPEAKLPGLQLVALAVWKCLVYCLRRL